MSVIASLAQFFQVSIQPYVYENGELKLCDFYVKYIGSSLWIAVEQIFIAPSCVSVQSCNQFFRMFPFIRKLIDPLNVQLTSVRLWVLLELLGYRNSCHFDLKLAWSVRDIFNKGECSCKWKSVLFSFYFVVKENVMRKWIF